MSEPLPTTADLMEHIANQWMSQDTPETPPSVVSSTIHDTMTILANTLDDIATTARTQFTSVRARSLIMSIMSAVEIALDAIAQEDISGDSELNTKQSWQNEHGSLQEPSETRPTTTPDSIENSPSISNDSERTHANQSDTSSQPNHINQETSTPTHLSTPPTNSCGDTSPATGIWDIPEPTSPTQNTIPDTSPNTSRNHSKTAQQLIDRVYEVHDDTAQLFLSVIQELSNQYGIEITIRKPFG